MTRTRTLACLVLLSLPVHASYCPSATVLQTVSACELATTTLSDLMGCSRCAGACVRDYSSCELSLEATFVSALLTCNSTGFLSCGNATADSFALLCSSSSNTFTCAPTMPNDGIFIANTLVPYWGLGLGAGLVLLLFVGLCATFLMLQLRRRRARQAKESSAVGDRNGGGRHRNNRNGGNGSQYDHQNENLPTPSAMSPIKRLSKLPLTFYNNIHLPHTLPPHNPPPGPPPTSMVVNNPTMMMPPLPPPAFAPPPQQQQVIFVAQNAPLLPSLPRGGSFTLTAQQPSLSREGSFTMPPPPGLALPRLGSGVMGGPPMPPPSRGSGVMGAPMPPPSRGSGVTGAPSNQQWR
jgi:hypothetical protein